MFPFNGNLQEDFLLMLHHLLSRRLHQQIHLQILTLRHVRTMYFSLSHFEYHTHVYAMT